jgi:hypothetical protein
MQNHCGDMPFLVAAGFPLLYPPCETILVGTAHPTRWIPASAGMTDKESAEGRSPFVEGLGVSPNSPNLPHEWGTKGG